MHSSFRLSNALMLVLATAVACPRIYTSATQMTGPKPNLQETVKLYEESCMGNLRTLNVAQGTYWGGDSRKGYARSLRELGPEGKALIVQALASGKKDGYRFLLRPVPASGNKPITHYSISARPIKLLLKGQRSFFTDETGVIRSTTENRAAVDADPPVD